MKVEIPSATVLTNSTITDKDFEEYQAFCKELENGITAEGIQAWISTWPFGSKNQKVVGVNVLENNVQSLQGLVAKLGASYHFRGNMLNYTLLSLPQEKYCTVRAAMMRIQTWLEKDFPTSSDESDPFKEVRSGVMTLANTLADKYWRMSECELVKMEILADPQEDFFFIDICKASPNGLSNSNERLQTMLASGKSIGDEELTRVPIHIN